MKSDKIVLLDYSMHFQTECANLKIVITKKGSIRIDLFRTFSSRKIVSVSDLQRIMGIEDCEQ